MIILKKAKTGMGKCIHRNHCHENFFVKLLKYPKGRFKIKALTAINVIVCTLFMAFIYIIKSEL